MKYVVVTLAVLSLVLTFTGALWGARSLRREYRQLSKHLGNIDEIIHDEAIPSEQKSGMTDAVLKPSSNWNDVKYLRENVRLYVIAQAWENLKLPTILVLAGAVLGATGDVVGALA